MPISVSSGSIQNSTVSGIDTGTGGFIVGSDGLAHVYDVGELDAVAVPLPQWSPGDINVDNTKRDLSKNTKATLADYLGKSTVSSKNTYKLDTSSNVELTLSDNNGYPQHLGSIPSSQPHFADLKPGRSDASANLNILRGKQPPHDGAVDGNKLLNDGEKGQPSKSVKEYYSSVMSANRFGSDEIYENSSGINAQQFAKKYPMGESLKPEDTRRNLTFARLSQVGNVLSLRSSQELNSLADEFNPVDTQAVFGALLPGKSQLGVEKISTTNLTAESVISELTKLGIGDELLINPTSDSWGSLNNNQDQFSGVTANGMKLLVTALVVAFSIVVILTSKLLTLLPVSEQIEKNDALGRRVFGSAATFGPKAERGLGSIIAGAVLGDFNIWKMLGVSPTDSPIDECISVGALSFFGISYTSTSSLMMTLDAMGGSELSRESSGYYTVAARSVLRSFMQIADMFASVGKAFSSNPLAGINAIVAIKNALATSRFMKVLGIFANIGNDVLVMKLEKDPKSLGPHPRYLTKLDNEPNESAGRGRIKVDGDNKMPGYSLSWASYTSRDMFIMPTSMKHFIKDFSTVGDTQTWKTSLSSMGAIKAMSLPEKPGVVPYEGVYIDNVASRIDTDVREAIEKSLDAEYVPFYFHDVRTNEIISFHAFLASLSDDYTANYDSADGIGRVETIKIYKSTNRKIGFSFHIVSTSEVDFDAMWLKINKLTTLVYPQFSAGRQISAAGNVMRMPFSQIIQASPLVRIRIGDLIKSNYSKFGLARLFGLNEPTSVVDGEKLSLPSQTPAKEAPYAKEGYRFALKSMDCICDMGRLTYEFYNHANGAWPKGIFLQIDSLDKDEDWKDIALCSVVVEKESTDGRTEAIINQEWARTRSNTNAPWKHILGISNIKIYVTDSLLVPSESTRELIKKDQDELNAAAQKYMTNVGVFMSDDNDTKKGNAIAKSFRSSGGKGLAGFIDSMSFDWYDKVTWDIDPGRRAPKTCKVTISFTPIHDITPGLDSSGFNRAPIYNVKASK